MQRKALVMLLAMIVASVLAHAIVPAAGEDNEDERVQASAQRDTGNAENTPTTPATEWHGLPANNPGHDDDFDTDGPAAQQLHGVANAPQNGGRDDEPPACDFHGGFNGEKSQCVDD
jgi:hypothetical protein